MGTLAKVVQFSRLADGALKALIEGRERVAIDSFETTAPFFTVQYHPMPGNSAVGRSRLRALMDSVAREFAGYVGQTPQLPEEAEMALEVVTDPEEMVNVVASNLMIGPDQAGVAGGRRAGPVVAAAGDAHPGERVHRPRE